MTLDQIPECWQPAVTAEIACRAERRRRDAKRRAIAANRKRRALLIMAAMKEYGLLFPEACQRYNASIVTQWMATKLRSGREIDALGRVLPLRDEHGRFKSKKPGGNPAPK